MNENESTIKFSAAFMQALEAQDIEAIPDNELQQYTADQIKQRRQLAFELLSTIGFSEFEKNNLLQWHRAVLKMQEDALRGFARNFRAVTQAGHGITFAGKTGSGKSTIAAALAFHGLLTYEVQSQEDARKFFSVIQFTDLVEQLVATDYGPKSRIVLIDNVRVLTGAELRRNLFENYCIKRDVPNCATWYSLQTDLNEVKAYGDTYPSVWSRQAKNLLILTRDIDFRATQARSLLELIRNNKS